VALQDLTPEQAPKRPSGWAAALRHPVVAGSLLAVITGIFASVLIPSLTRVWQDRPRELALKRELVARISREGSTAVDSASVGVGPRRGQAFYDRTIRRWRTESSIIGAELTTYFPTSAARRKWQDYAGIVNYVLHAVAYDEGPGLASDSLVRDHFRRVRFDDPVNESMRKGVIRGAVAKAESVLTVSVLLLEERDEIAADIVEAEAAGFSHGFWIFG
jgi:hypothetical protein